jgi:2-polyprenyl-6-methoxyphenol hydroxylase-like FAD-dependent oxidoreductase
MTEKLLVLGAGMAGLFTALAFAPGTREIVMLERDPPLPEGGVEAAFAEWHRRGVGQLRHSHGFLARMRNVIKARHPALLDRLREAGCHEISFADMMPVALRQTYQPQAGDEDMVILTSRRTTFEFIVRRYVEALDGVTIVSDAFVRELIVSAEPGAPLRVQGARGEQHDQPHEWLADVVIDAQGRLSEAKAQLIAAGAVIPEESEDCGILYFTRHYRRTTETDPPVSRATGTGDLGYIKYGRFPGDNGCFSITLAVPEVETALRQAVLKPEVFDQVCAMFPGIAAWVDPAGSEPSSRVFGMGDLKSHWRRFVSPERRAILGFFALGDSLIRTNPLYGRGCSFAAVESEILQGVLDETDDPALRARLYDARVTTALRPYFEDMRSQDRSAIRRAANALDPTYRAPLRAKVLRSFVGDGVGVAVRADVDLLREAMREFNMVDPPRAWLRRPENMLKVVGHWARGRNANARYHPPPLGPDRAGMMAALGLDASSEPQAA